MGERRGCDYQSLFSISPRDGVTGLLLAFPPNLSLNYLHAVQSIGTIHDFQTLQVYNKKYNTMKTFVIATMLELENNCHIEQNLYDHFKLYI